ncbi:MAG: BrnT family toxin [Bryobacteraceae bacterium]
MCRRGGRRAWTRWRRCGTSKAGWHLAGSGGFEERFVTLGVGIKGRVLTVVYCYSGEDIGIISARIAGRPERERYEAQR